MSGQKKAPALAIIPYDGNSNPPPAKKAKTVAPAPAPAPVPEKERLQPVDFEVVQMAHENVMTGTVDAVLRCLACGKLTEPKIMIKKVVKTFAITTTGVSYKADYEVANGRPACEGCTAKFKVKEVTK
jgi:DNA-binding helix-hairpin-helix protein with protein kinase domain